MDINLSLKIRKNISQVIYHYADYIKSCSWK